MYHIAYLRDDGVIRTRGRNNYGQLGNGNNTNNTTSSETVSGISTATKIVAAQANTCALLSNGQVWCTGIGSKGENGDGTTNDRNSPVQVNLPSDTAVDIFASRRSLAAVLADGRAYGWGENTGSKILCTTSDSSTGGTPRQITSFTNIKQVDYGTYHSILLTNDGKVYTCGTVYKDSNVAGNAAFYALFGSAQYMNTNGPILMDGFGDGEIYDGRAIHVRASGTNSYIMLDNGSVVCTGSNTFYQCSPDGTIASTGGSDYQKTPIIIPGL